MFAGVAISIHLASVCMYPSLLDASVFSMIHMYICDGFRSG